MVSENFRRAIIILSSKNIPTSRNNPVILFPEPTKKAPAVKKRASYSEESDLKYRFLMFNLQKKYLHIRYVLLLIYYTSTYLYLQHTVLINIL